MRGFRRIRGAQSRGVRPVRHRLNQRVKYLNLLYGSDCFEIIVSPLLSVFVQVVASNHCYYSYAND